MPVLDGPALICAIRAMDPDLPVIGSSGLIGLDARGIPEDIKVTSWVPKPYSAQVLLSAVREALDAAPQG